MSSKKRILRSFLFLLLLNLMIDEALAFSMRRADFFVDFNRGNDTAAGTSEAPFKTLEGALNALPKESLEDSFYISLAGGNYTSVGSNHSVREVLELDHPMRDGVTVRIVGQGNSTVLNWSGMPLVMVTQGDWSIENVQIGSRLEGQRRGVQARGSGSITLRDVRIHTGSQSDAGILATNGGTVSLFGKIELNEDFHEKLPEGDSFCGIEAQYSGVVRFRQKEGASLSIGNGWLSSRYYGIIELGCETARITSWHEQANVIAVNNSGRIDFHNTKALLTARNPRNTPIGLEDDGHVLAEGAPITIQGCNNSNAIVLQKASAFFCNDVTLQGSFHTPLLVMSSSTLLVGIIGDLDGGDVTTGGKIIIEKITGKLTKSLNAWKAGVVVVPEGLATESQVEKNSEASNTSSTPVATATPKPAEISIGELSPLHQAAKSGDKGKVCELLLEKGTSIDQRDQSGRTPLHWAVYGGHQDLAAFLLSKGADLKARDKEGMTPLDLAIQQDHSDLTKFLKQKSK